MLSTFFKKHVEIIKTVKDKYKLIFIYLSIVIFLGLTESLGIALLFPISEILQNQEIATSYNNIFLNYTGYEISNEYFILLIFLSAFSLFLFSGSSQIISFRIAAMLTDGLYSLWQQMIFKRYLNARYSFFIENMSGDLVQRLILHSEKGVQVVNHVCLIIKEVILISFIVIVISTLSLKLTLFLFLLGALFTITSIIFGKLNIFKAANNVAYHQKNAVSIVSESINAIKLVKVYSLEKILSKKFSDEISKRAKFLIYNQSFINVPGVILRTLTLLIMLTALFVVARSNLENTSQIISFLVIFAGAGYRINGSIGTMNNSFLSLANVIPSLIIISNELSSKQDFKNTNKDLITNHSFEDQIIFDNVCFSYLENNMQILKNVNFTVKKGSLIGIVGESGSGKSTIIDLLLKLYDVEEGNIYIDRHNLKAIDKLAWRSKIGYVGQNTQILSGDIQSNITLKYDQENKTQKSIINAVQIADIEDFIMSLPKKFKTEISENGDNVSAGQKQRIAISRAIYSNPDIMLFDEATSNLNPSLEKKIFFNLRGFCKDNKTTLIYVTHRTSLLDELDEIIFIKDGKVVTSGKHDDLMTQSSEYFDFIRKYKKEF